MGIKEDILRKQKGGWRKTSEDLMVILLMGILMVVILFIILFVVELVFKIPDKGHSRIPTTLHYRINK